MSGQTLSQQRLMFLEKLHDQSAELLREVRFQKSPYRDGYLICLYASMIELSGGIVLLIGQDRKTALSSVFRSFMEAYTDFKNVATERSYVKHCFARHHKDWIKVLGTTHEPNPFLDAIHAHHERDASLEQHDAELRKLKDEGIQILKIEDKFAKAEMEDEYRSIYHFESDAAHNGWSALMERHFEMEGDELHLALYKAHALDDYEIYLDSAAAMLVDATVRLHEQLNSGKQREVEVLQLELAAIRAKAKVI